MDKQAYLLCLEWHRIVRDGDGNEGYTIVFIGLIQLLVPTRGLLVDLELQVLQIQPLSHVQTRPRRDDVAFLALTKHL